MQNYVMNILNLIGDRTRIYEVLEAIKRDDLPMGSIDFNKIIPAPLNAEGLHSCRWRREHWGTQWNSVTFVDFDFLEPQEIEENTVQIVFQTANAGVRPIIEKLAQTNPDLCFEYMWAEESMVAEECGGYVYVNGMCVCDHFPEGKEAIEFSLSVWDLEDYYDDYLESYLQVSNY